MNEEQKNYSEIDKEEVDKIVEAMKKKYREEGMQFEEVSGTLKELRGIIAEESYSKIDINNEEDIQNFDSKTSQFLGSVYLKLKGILKPIQKKLKKFPSSRELGYYLYSANMRYSSNQYLALASAVGFLAAVVTLVSAIIIGIFLQQNIILIAILPIVISFIVGLFATIVALMIPKQKAIARGNACSVELPFALRHMATELKAGIGLYKTIQAVTVADYGTLSEEFARTINEIEEGTDTGVALKHLALRTQSRPLKMAIMHIIRAMRIGGNLSEIMSDIAEDVSEDLKNRIQAFSQKMNLFSVIFIFMGIVIPVGITIIGAILNSPMTLINKNLIQTIPLTPLTLMLFYFVVMPVLFVIMNVVIYTIQPRM